MNAGWFLDDCIALIALWYGSFILRNQTSQYADVCKKVTQREFHFLKQT